MRSEGASADCVGGGGSLARTEQNPEGVPGRPPTSTNGNRRALG